MSLDCSLELYKAPFAKLAEGAFAAMFAFALSKLHNITPDMAEIERSVDERREQKV